MKKSILTLGILVAGVTASFGQSHYTTTLGPGHGFRLGGSDHYKLHLGYNGNGTGEEFYYGPVQSWAVKMNNFPSSTQPRGWVWGVSTPGEEPVAALGIKGDMQIKGNFVAEGRIGIGITSPARALDVNGSGSFSGQVVIGSQTGVTAFATLAVDNVADQIGISTNSGMIGVMGNAGVGLSGNSTYGVWGKSHGAQNISCGVHGDSYSGNYGYGIWGSAYGAGTANYGVLGEATGVNAYAGYFTGNVYTTGLYQSSDRKLKENIKPLKNTAKLMLLQPKEYTYRTDEFQSMNLEEGAQMGFIAQDIEAIFPELIKETVQPPTVDKEGKIIKEGITFKAVNYIALIPLLTATVQEQNMLIEEQEESITELMDRVSQLENNTSTGIENDEIKTEVELFQNSPNPFNEKTVIKYSLPVSTNQASIMIFDMNGTHKLTIEANVLAGEISVNAKDLSPGIYIYSLIADRTEVATKRMIITE